MKYIIFFCLLIVGLNSCTDKSKQYEPAKVLSSAQLDIVLQDLIVYTDEHVPDSINAENRFQDKNKSFFLGLTSKYWFKYLTKNTDGSYSYLAYKKARGTDDLYVGLGGTFTLSPEFHITSLKESFRMWRMGMQDLDKKGLEVYTDFVEGKPLDQYMNSEEKQYVEFPNDHVVYDPAKHEWKLIKLYE